MNSVLGKRDAKQGFFNRRAVSAIIMIIVIATVLWYAVHHVQSWMHLHPQMSMLMPAIAVGCLMAILPLVMFLSFQDEFLTLNPILPSHYWFLCKKTYRAVQNNNFKVSGKDF